ncbi:MAG: hypothetical protein JWP86_2009 [Phenylobacterium sp.]|nr:hypothetical protein [Phenylobacterium sp.]MDB5494672.1 hypothetical protein [Phenylobacterium sp.]
MNLILQPVMVDTGEEGEACLVFAEGWLVAVLVRLSDNHAGAEGFWFLEKGFGRLDCPDPPSFSDLECAQQWIREHLEIHRPPRWPGDQGHT